MLIPIIKRELQEIEQQHPDSAVPKTSLEVIAMKRLQSVLCVILSVLLLTIVACSRPMVIQEAERPVGDAANVQVWNVEDNKGGKYVVSELKENGLFFHDRMGYTIEDIPEEFLGLTQIQTSADSPGGQDYRLTFEIDRPAYVYTAWDGRHKRPEERGQDPEGWFTDNYTDTGKTLHFGTEDHIDESDYWIYRSKKPYPKGKVELLGIDEVMGDPVIMWTIFLK